MPASIHKQRGQILIITALSLLVLIGVVGLAVDSGLAYIVKAKLNSALDSASLAAARAVALGTDQATQANNARVAAQHFFDINYPDHYLNSEPVLNPTLVNFDQGKVTIDVSASARLPVTFMGLFGFSPQTSVAATAQTVRKDLDMALVMDTSGSLLSVADTVRSSAITFLKQFTPGSDRVALVHFAYGAQVDDPIRTSGRGFDLGSATKHITSYAFDGSTNSSEGMWNARDQLNKINVSARSTLRVIVFFSDGAPNSFSSVFPFPTPADCAKAGTVTTNDSTSANWPGGLYDPYQDFSELNGASDKECWQSQYSNWVKYVTYYGLGDIHNIDASTGRPAYITKLPDWYNTPHPADGAVPPQEFKIVTSTPRVVTSDTSNKTIVWKNVNRAARNLLEAVASKARDEDIYVFSLGLGSGLTSGSGPDSEKGEDLLKNIANTPDSKTYNPAKPVGVYCYAATATDLNPCFSRLASAILRISK